jgi:hypothetical protein
MGVSVVPTLPFLIDGNSFLQSQRLIPRVGLRPRKTWGRLLTLEVEETETGRIVEVKIKHLV